MDNNIEIASSPMEHTFSTRFVTLAHISAEFSHAIQRQFSEVSRMLISNCAHTSHECAVLELVHSYYVAG